MGVWRVAEEIDTDPRISICARNQQCVAVSTATGAAIQTDIVVVWDVCHFGPRPHVLTYPLCGVHGGYYKGWEWKDEILNIMGGYRIELVDKVENLVECYVTNKIMLISSMSSIVQSNSITIRQYKIHITAHGELEIIDVYFLNLRRMFPIKTQTR